MIVHWAYTPNYWPVTEVLRWQVSPLSSIHTYTYTHILHLHLPKQKQTSNPTNQPTKPHSTPKFPAAKPSTSSPPAPSPSPSLTPQANPTPTTAPRPASPSHPAPTTPSASSASRASVPQRAASWRVRRRITARQPRGGRCLRISRGSGIKMYRGGM